jgi:hypothetical protein
VDRIVSEIELRVEARDELIGVGVTADSVRLERVEHAVDVEKDHSLQLVDRLVGRARHLPPARQEHSRLMIQQKPKSSDIQSV